jgi:hypothetical protein
VPDTGLAVDTIRQNVRAAADSYIQRMKPKEEEGKPPVYELKFEDLFNTLQEKAQVSALEPITVIHLADGLVEELNKDHDAVLADGERLNVVQIDVKVA